ACAPACARPRRFSEECEVESQGAVASVSKGVDEGIGECVLEVRVGADAWPCTPYAVGCPNAAVGTPMRHPCLKGVSAPLRKMESAIGPGGIVPRAIGNRRTRSNEDARRLGTAWDAAGLALVRRRARRAAWCARPQASRGWRFVGTSVQPRFE